MGEPANWHTYIFNDLIKLYLKEGNNTISDEVLEETRSLIMQMLNKRVSPLHCKSHLMHKIGTSEPADRILTIMNISENPSKFAKNICKIDAKKKMKRKQIRKWAEIDDKRLLAGILIHGFDWQNVAKFVGNGMTFFQCSQRWNRVLNPSIEKGPWTVEEEKKLMDLVKHYGNKAWTTISKEMKTRSDVQCRYKYILIDKNGSSLKESQKSDHLMNNSLNEYDSINGNVGLNFLSMSFNQSCSASNNLYFQMPSFTQTVTSKMTSEVKNETPKMQIPNCHTNHNGKIENINESLFADIAKDDVYSFFNFDDPSEFDMINL
ncbi:r2r3-MYB transcription factor [Tritrichomonas foetus]|uniref:R2r3-MYB transcription factor n=1 Tax=Tritrichomonas foetus TaxID=1144522 RepID=A0A1J4JAB3_9EUKA|nr:r2r3-MYB transcription factor [Tritrichomonas foetus]|eukprot:OHS96118.1 r2r3-MYB transcription factor [Tritrichomonas foetus]